MSAFDVNAKPTKNFIGIMLFYIFLAYVIMPILFYYFSEKSLDSAGTGFVVGSLVSIGLWYSYGSKMV